MLRYHYRETLVRTLGGTITREEEPDDSVGFVRIDAPHPAHFVVQTAYRSEAR